MLSIRSHPKLRLLFKLSTLTGYNIPENVKTKKSLLTAWELTNFAWILVTLILLLYTFSKQMVGMRLAEITPLAIMFLMYFSILAKMINLFRRKRQLLELFALMEDLTSFAPFSEYQKPVVDLVCKRIHKTVILLTGLVVGFVFLGSSIFYAISTLGQFLNRQSNATESLHEQTAKTIMRINKDLDWIEKLAYSTNGVLNYLVPLKSIILDCFMFLCHYFVVQQLNLLNRKFHLFKQRSSQTKTFRKFGVEENHFDQWLAQFNKIRTIHQKVGHIFELHSILVIGNNIVSLCFIAFLAAKNPSIYVIISLALYAMGFIVQVFSCCRSGQNLKDAVWHLANKVSTGPWEDLGITPSLNLVVIELQRSFSAKGGPFFTFHLEFFASIMGAVFTYFIILVQIKE